MRKSLFLFLLALVCACTPDHVDSGNDGDKKRYDGDWTPMYIKNQEITFPAEGGSATATVTNYGGWYFTGAAEYAFVNNVWVLKSGTSNGAITISKHKDMLAGSWFLAYIPHGTQTSRTADLVVVVDKNDTGAPRQLFIDVGLFDVSSCISVTQSSE